MEIPQLQPKAAPIASAEPRRAKPQSFVNGEIHDWYRLVLGYSDHLVADLIAEFQLNLGANVLDPFAGSGTTGVECMKRGINCWLIDANPAACFAARVKTTWDINIVSVRNAVERVCANAMLIRPDFTDLRKDETYRYIKTTGMLDRGWIDANRLYDVLALKLAIRTSVRSARIADFLRLALVHEIVHSASNVRFGPELYCGKRRRSDVAEAFRAKALSMVNDLEPAEDVTRANVRVFEGDSRQCGNWIHPPAKRFDAIICSPPYPTEHDYTRNTRLELALLEMVTSKDTLRGVKKRMIRSHTKGVYNEDQDSSFVDSQSILALAGRINERAKGKEYGFARLYGRVTLEYFGGMRRHFDSVLPLLRRGGKAAYVVGDQASYLGEPIPTAALLGDVASRAGFTVLGIRKWRQRWASTSKQYLDENILILARP
jgi:methylase of polypeptide subunit release factors